MARPIEVVKDINDSKDLWKIAVRCKHLWTITSASNKEHIEMILVDSKVWLFVHERNKLLQIIYCNLIDLYSFFVA